MNDLSPFILLLIAVLVAAFPVFVLAVLFLLGRKLVTGRPVWTSRLLYFLIAPLMIVAFVGPYLYAKSKGIDEHIIVKWMNILIAAVFVFGFAVRRFWGLHRKWTFWMALSVLITGHFALLSLLRWKLGAYFWLVVVVGVPEMAFIFFVLGLIFRSPKGRTAAEIADIIE